MLIWIKLNLRNNHSVKRKNVLMSFEKNNGGAS